MGECVIACVSAWPWSADLTRATHWKLESQGEANKAGDTEQVFPAQLWPSTPSKDAPPPLLLLKKVGHIGLRELKLYDNLEG